MIDDAENFLSALLGTLSASERQWLLILDRLLERRVLLHDAGDEIEVIE
jgi:hypothetical protein